MQSPDTEDRLSLLEARVAEMQRRTMSSLTVTNPTDGIAYLQVTTGHVRLRDQTGSTILDTAASPSFGYAKPLQNYVGFVQLPSIASAGFVGPLVKATSATFRPNAARLNVTTLAFLETSTTGIGDYQVQYTVDGGAPTVIPASVGVIQPAAAFTQQLLSWSYVWPSDYFGHKIELQFMARVRPATGDPLLDDILITPLRLYGAPL